MVPGMVILAGGSAKNNSTRFRQESQGHDKDLFQMCWAVNATERRTVPPYKSVAQFISELKLFIHLHSYQDLHYLQVHHLPHHLHQLKGPDAIIGSPSFLLLDRSMLGMIQPLYM